MMLKAPFDEQTVPGTSPDDLNSSLWNRFRTVISPKANQEFLEKMKLIVRDEDAAVRATVSGILMAIETSQFSMNAVFEAVVNAVAHRDYSIYGSRIRLDFIPDSEME